MLRPSPCICAVNTVLVSIQRLLLTCCATPSLESATIPGQPLHLARCVALLPFAIAEKEVAYYLLSSQFSAIIVSKIIELHQYVLQKVAPSV